MPHRLSPVLIGGIVAVAFTQIASAADLPRKAPPAPPPPPPVYSWTGFYLGGNLGGAWGKSEYTFIPGSAWSAANAAQLAADGSTNLNMSSVSGGLQAGYNWQMNQIVLGIEADFQYIGLKEDNTFTRTATPPGVSLSLPYTFTKSSKSDWLSTVRGRLGYAWNNVLIYGTGGLAIAESKSSDTLDFTAALGPGFVSTGSRSDVQLGWTAGGGVEWAFNNRWTAKVEYLYARFPTETTAKSTFAGNPIFFDAYTDRLTVNVARLGVNYRF